MGIFLVFVLVFSSPCAAFPLCDKKSSVYKLSSSVGNFLNTVIILFNFTNNFNNCEAISALQKSKNRSTVNRINVDLREVCSGTRIVSSSCSCRPRKFVD